MKGSRFVCPELANACVMINPGAMALQRIPSAACWVATYLVRDTTPPLDVPYATRAISPTKADPEAVLTIAPPPPRTICGMAKRHPARSEEHTSELQVTNAHLVCRLLLEKKTTIYKQLRTIDTHKWIMHRNKS